ncbi:hypothetical protein EJV47_24810 [Hymenobacter gummosus]|uniref:Lipoprotein n=1 Tax=Hymenobacter gummosus TaxID=1776032 RepID=A0A3S0K1J2_9BACT|nr:hypothetical protein [Hymenobacter gummosus]RTQ45710.1 hypothetical protein EJV47_24810 [Hymenobacter gummosus]
MLRRLPATTFGLLFTLGAGLLLGACDNTTEAPLEMGKDYYPLKVGAERVFDVEDKVWRNNQVVTTPSQVREQLTETYRDAAGVLTYKLVRSSRTADTNPWRLDSVFTLTVNDKSLLLTRSNLRTVELVFPVRNGAEWNRNAFNTLDPLGALNRRYEEVGSAQTVAGRSYDNTATVYDELQDNLFYLDVQRQVYAKGVGPVLREVRKLNYCQGGSSCAVSQTNKYIVSGTEHRETLRP